MRHRTGGSTPPAEESSEDDEEDAFSAFNKKRKKHKASSSSSSAAAVVVPLIKVQSDEEKPPADATKQQQQQQQLPVSSTSSTKRHHGAASDTRKAKMDALLMELEAEKDRVSKEPARAGGGPARKQKGSYVEDGDEYVTTNIFVGNLAPSITEEQMTELFRQFGEAAVCPIRCVFSC